MKILSTDPLKVAKSIMPRGYDAYYNPSFSWRKRGGHAGSNQLDKAVERATALGFKPGLFTPTGSPDGAVVGGISLYHHPDGWELQVFSSYGVTASSNRFTVILKSVLTD